MYLFNREQPSHGKLLLKDKKVFHGRLFKLSFIVEKTTILASHQVGIEWLLINKNIEFHLCLHGVYNYLYTHTGSSGV